MHTAANLALAKLNLIDVNLHAETRTLKMSNFGSVKFGVMH
nr:hypothetical protein [uncultured Campylobacter sp.]